MANYRQIISKAVVAKGRKSIQSTHTIRPTNAPSSILGAWIINHAYEAKKVGKTVEIHGTYDINCWYSCNNNTKTDVATEKVTYKDVINLRYRDDQTIEDKEVIAKVTQQPNCAEATISKNGDEVIVTAERGFIVEVIGETKIVVAVGDDDFLDDEDDWEYDLDDEEFEELNPDFLVQGEEE